MGLEQLKHTERSGKAREARLSDDRPPRREGAPAMRYEDYNSLMVDQAGAIGYICDLHTHELLHLTAAGMDLYGVKRPEEYQGQKCYQFLQGMDKPCPFCTNSRLREGLDYRWEHYNKKLGRWFDATDVLLHINGRRCRMETVRDITARKDVNAPASGQMTMEDILFRCLHTLTTENDMNRAVDLFLEGVGGYYQANRAYIMEFDLVERTMSNTFEWCRSGVSQEIGNLQNLPLSAFSHWIHKFETSGGISIHSVHDELDPDSEDYRILEAQGIVSLMAVPLQRDGEIVGYIAINDPGQKEGDLTLLRSVSEFVLAELERRRLVAELEYMSYIDPLTGLRNLNLFDRMLKEYDHKTPDSLGVVTVNINGMKAINEAHGNSYGDHIIIKTGGLMAENLSGRVFRIGGDEFAALYESIPRDAFQQEVIALRRAFEGERDCATALGCAWSDGEANTQSLLRRANELLAAEKQSYYHTVLAEGRATVHTGASGEVVKEIEEGRFMAYYQPQVDLKTGRIIGAEALVRKLDERGGLIPPNKFIPLYEMEGVISHVDLFVLGDACAAVRRWTEEGLPLRVSVNFSRMTLMQPNIVRTISDICAEKGVAPSSIMIEVTESVSKIEYERLMALIGELKAAGFSISLDDFGSEYSNLSILSAVEFEEIKFDKTLVSSLEQNPKSRVVMENAIRMCHGMGATSTLAEGIETRGQLELLLEYHCDWGQGYYFSRPVPPEQFRELLKRTLG